MSAVQIRRRLRQTGRTRPACAAADVLWPRLQPALLSDRYGAQILTLAIFTVTAATSIDCAGEQPGESSRVLAARRALSLPQDGQGQSMNKVLMERIKTEIIKW